MIIPEPQHSIAGQIDDCHEADAEGPRVHLGASLLGHPCRKYLWLSFRWAGQERFPGRVLRLFRRGQREEATVISDLRRIGVKVQSAQTRVDLGCHMGGSMDGIAIGVPGGGLKPHVLEIKTHNRRSFNDLEKKGVERAKPMHWVQMQLYMLGMPGKTKVDRALYFAVCKDDDRIYTERVRYDKESESYVERGREIVLASTSPHGISDNPTWYQCRMCSCHSFCHMGGRATNANCRTCAHSTPLANSTWRCERHEADDIPEDFQRSGCEDHVIHPDLVPWDRVVTGSNIEATYIIEGREVRNGHPDAHCFASSEILANPKACLDALDGGPTADLRNKLGGRISE